MKLRFVAACAFAGLVIGASLSVTRSANAVVFDVNGSNSYTGETVTGTIEGDALLNSVTSVDLQVSNDRVPANIILL